MLDCKAFQLNEYEIFFWLTLKEYNRQRIYIVDEPEGTSRSSLSNAHCTFIIISSITKLFSSSDAVLVHIRTTIHQNLICLSGKINKTLM